MLGQEDVKDLLGTKPGNTVPNVVLLDKVLEQIDYARNDPEAVIKWDQTNWSYKTECGTAMCFAGWAASLDGAKWHNPEGQFVYDPTKPGSRMIHVSDYGQEALGLDSLEANLLFTGHNTYEDLVEAVRLIKQRHNL